MCKEEGSVDQHVERFDKNVEKVRSEMDGPEVVKPYATGSGQHAYHVYGDSVGWTNFRGDPMPAFGDLPESIRQAWDDVAQAMIGVGQDWVL